MAYTLKRGNTMQDVYLSLGSNINAQTNTCSAVQALRGAFGELRLSFVYQTPAIGFDGDDFLNLAVHFATHNTPQAIQQILYTIENQHGRQRHTARFSARTLDIDLLLYADRQLDLPGLKLPRDEMTTYAFVLAPLADIASDVIHPQRKCSIGALWVKFCQDNPKEVGAIRKIPFSFIATCHHRQQ